MKNLSFYLDLSYTEKIRKDEEGDFVAEIEELPGCVAHGATKEKALEALDEARRLWIEERIKSGFPVPQPDTEEDLPSGKWVQRVPRSIHNRLTMLAKREGVSLNQLVTSIVSEAVGVLNGDVERFTTTSSPRPLRRLSRPT